MNWLAAHFSTLTLDEAHEGYFLGRGGTKSGFKLPSLSNLQWRMVWQQWQRRTHFSNSDLICSHRSFFIWLQSISLTSGSG